MQRGLCGAPLRRYTQTQVKSQGFRMRRALIFAALGLAATACSPVVTQHGYIGASDPTPPAPGVDTKETIEARMGTPSTTGVFEDTWYYISATREEFAYTRPTITNQSIMAIHFNEDGSVANVENFGIDAAREVRVAGGATPTRGRQLTVWEQIFGSLSTVATQQLPGRTDTLPDSAGGPNPF